MTSLMPYLAIGILPITFLFGYSFNPIEFSWAYRHGRMPMTESVRETADMVRRYASFLGDGLLLTLIAILARKSHITAAEIGLHFANWRIDSAIGIVTGLTLVLVQGLVARFCPINPRYPFAQSIRQGPVSLWILIFVAGAFSEELWMALSLVLLRATEHALFFSVLITAFVVGAVHYGYGLGGAIASSAKSTISALLFWSYGSLFVTFFYHLVGNLGSLYWNRFHQQQASSAG